MNGSYLITREALRDCKFAKSSSFLPTEARASLNFVDESFFTCLLRVQILGNACFFAGSGHTDGALEEAN